MTEQNPYNQLGVAENASFDEIQSAKQRLSEQYQNDMQQLHKIESAYDAIIMDRLRMRQEGKIKVPDGIRFAEKVPETPQAMVSDPTTNYGQSLSAWFTKPEGNTLSLSSSLFGSLSLLTLLAPFVVTPSPSSFFLSLGFFANLYLGNRKDNKFFRSILFSLLGLCLGLLLGAGLASLHLPFFTLSIDDLSVLTTLVCFWIISNFLR